MHQPPRPWPLSVTKRVRRIRVPLASGALQPLHFAMCALGRALHNVAQDRARAVAGSSPLLAH